MQTQNQTRLLVGLGNPESKFKNTRHNVGSNFVEFAVSRSTPSSEIDKPHFRSFEMPDLTLIIPKMHMNESGKSVADVMKFFNFKPKDVVIVQDDLETEIGRWKIKEGGSAKGHNGIKSIIKHIGTQDFKRILIGIGRPESRDQEEVSKYVLAKFKPEELDKIKKVYHDILAYLGIPE